MNSNTTPQEISHLVLELKVKFVKGPGLGLEEIEGIEGELFGNLDNGNLELHRRREVKKGEDGGKNMPFFSRPWQKIAAFDGEEEGRFGRVKMLYVKFDDKSELILEVHEKKISIQEIVSDCFAFKNAAKEKHPKGATERAVESLSAVTGAFGDALGKGIGKGLGAFGKIKKKKDPEDKKKKK